MWVYVVLGQVRAWHQVNMVVILGMHGQNIDLFFAEYVCVILVFSQQPKSNVFSVFTSLKAHPTYKHVIGILA